jgi:LPXTG-motif cell wall-anchored protein
VSSLLLSAVTRPVFSVVWGVMQPTKVPNLAVGRADDDGDLRSVWRLLLYSSAPPMALLRPTVILLACLALLASAGVADAASRLTPTPPVSLPATSSPGPSAAAPAPAPSASPAPSSAPAPSSSPASGSTALPRTGDDLTLQLLLAAGLVLAGGALRIRSSRAA